MFVDKIPESKINISRFYTYHYRIKKTKTPFNGDRHPFWEMHIVLNGGKVLTCEDKIINLSKGQMYLIPPHKFHSYVITETDMEYIVLTFDMDFVPPDAAYNLSEDNINLIRIMIKEMRENFPGGNFNDESKTAPQTLKLLAELLILRAVSHDAIPCVRNAKSDTFETAVSFMNANILERITLTDIANHCKISNSSLKKLFKLHTRKGVMHYFNGLKMEYAKKMLKDGNQISTVADELNFSSQAYFSAAFKQYTGISPLAFKKKIQ